MTILTAALVQVIVSSIRTNRARCALHMKILDLLEEESFLERAVVELVNKFDEKSMFEKVSRIAKVQFNFFWSTNIYTYGHQPRSHNPLLAHARAG